MKFGSGAAVRETFCPGSRGQVDTVTEAIQIAGLGYLSGPWLERIAHESRTQAAWTPRKFLVMVTQ